MRSDVQSRKSRKRRSLFGTKRTGVIEIVFDADREAQRAGRADVATGVGSRESTQESECEQQDSSGTELPDSGVGARRKGIRQLVRRSTTRLLSVFWGRGSISMYLCLEMAVC